MFLVRFGPRNVSFCKPLPGQAGCPPNTFVECPMTIPSLFELSMQTGPLAYAHCIHSTGRTSFNVYWWQSDDTPLRLGSSVTYRRTFSCGSFCTSILLA